MAETPYGPAEYEADRATLHFHQNTLLVPASLKLRRNKLARGKDAATVAAIDAACARLLAWVQASTATGPAMPDQLEPLHETLRDDAPNPTGILGQGGSTERPVSADWLAELEKQRQRNLHRRPGRPLLEPPRDRSPA